MQTSNRRQRFRRSCGALALLGWALAAQPAPAKRILKGVEPSENRVIIRTDGLACYFCAYGLERFFKKTRRIATFDLQMEEGLVEAVFVRGQPLVPAATLARFVHQAGFTPRWIDAELVGTLQLDAEGEPELLIRETGERIPVDLTDAVREYLGRVEQPAATVVTVRGRASEDDISPMRLAPRSIREEAAS